MNAYYINEYTKEKELTNLCSPIMVFRSDHALNALVCFLLNGLFGAIIVCLIWIVIIAWPGKVFCLPLKSEKTTYFLHHIHTAALMVYRFVGEDCTLFNVQWPFELIPPSRCNILSPVCKYTTYFMRSLPSEHLSYLGLMLNDSKELLGTLQNLRTYNPRGG